MINNSLDDKTEAFIKKNDSDSSSSDSPYGVPEKMIPDSFTAVRKQKSMKNTFD